VSADIVAFSELYASARSVLLVCIQNPHSGPALSVKIAWSVLSNLVALNHNEIVC